MKFLTSLMLSAWAFTLLSGAPNTPPDGADPNPESPYGAIVWYTLVTPDLEESMAFYKTVLDWEITAYDLGGQKAALVRYAGRPMASMVELDGADASLWIASISVRDLREITRKFESNGGRALLKPFEVQGTGKQVVLEGPLGEKLGFIENPAHPVSQLTNGDQQWIWAELWSTDPDRSRAFYQDVLGLAIVEKDQDGRPYWMLTRDGENVAGMLRNPAEGARSQWVPYVNVQDIPDFYETLKNSTATVLLGPEKGYRNGNIVIFEDPHKAMLCIQRYP